MWETFTACLSIILMIHQTQQTHQFISRKHININTFSVRCACLISLYTQYIQYPNPFNYIFGRWQLRNRDRVFFIVVVVVYSEQCEYIVIYVQPRLDCDYYISLICLLSMNTWNCVRYASYCNAVTIIKMEQTKKQNKKNECIVCALWTRTEQTIWFDCALFDYASTALRRFRLNCCIFWFTGKKNPFSPRWEMIFFFHMNISTTWLSWFYRKFPMTQTRLHLRQINNTSPGITKCTNYNFSHDISICNLFYFLYDARQFYFFFSQLKSVPIEGNKRNEIYLLKMCPKQTIDQLYSFGQLDVAIMAVDWMADMEDMLE